MLNFDWRPLENGEDLTNYLIVGQSVGNTTTTEFVILKTWTYGEIAQTGLLCIITAWFIFMGIWKIIRRKNYNLK